MNKMDEEEKQKCHQCGQNKAGEGLCSENADRSKDICLSCRKYNIAVDANPPSIDGEIIVGYALDEGEDYSFLDPEPITGHTLLEEIRFSLYATQAELTRLEKLLDTYEDVSRLQR